MNREELIDKLITIISTHRVHSTIEVDGSTMIYLYWDGFNNYIQVEGFDTENIYIRKFIKNNEVKNVPVMKLHNAPYKILRKLYNFLSEHFPLNK
jgi:hypothetical protein